MSLTPDEVARVSLLARLQLDDDELNTMTVQLGQIVDYVHQLAALDTEGVEPMAHAMEMRDVFRDDDPGSSLDRKEALANAPKHDDQCYRVPAVLGE